MPARTFVLVEGLAKEQQLLVLLYVKKLFGQLNSSLYVPGLFQPAVPALECSCATAL